MWTFILKNWKIGVGFAAGIIVAGTYHNIDRDWETAKAPR